MTVRADQAQVATRHVFYVPGYDPFPTRRYREMYRREAAIQAAISGYALSVQGAPGGASWDVSAQMEGAQTRTRMEVLEWADLVRASMPGGIVAVYGALFRTAWIYVRSGVLFRLFFLRKGPVLAALYPVVALLAQLALALALWVGVARVGASFGPLWGALGLGLGGVLCWGLLRAFRRLDRRFLADYLMQDYAYSARLNGAYPPALEARLDVFADRIAEALQGDADEVLVVGHSSGAYLGVSLLARLERAGRLEGHKGGRVGFLSLGHVVPMVSLLPGADALREDLSLMGAQSHVFWLDVTAPGDGCAFALCHPVGVSGVAGPQTRWPLVISARFSQTLQPQTWKALRWRFFRLHFQYLHAFDKPGDYDYFQITAGPQTLRQRFEGRPASPSVKGAP